MSLVGHIDLLLPLEKQKISKGSICVIAVIMAKTHRRLIYKLYGLLKEQVYFQIDNF